MLGWQVFKQLTYILERMRWDNQTTSIQLIKINYFLETDEGDEMDEMDESLRTGPTGPRFGLTNDTWVTWPQGPRVARRLRSQSLDSGLQAKFDFAVTLVLVIRKAFSLIAISIIGIMHMGHKICGFVVALAVSSDFLTNLPEACRTCFD